MPASVSILKDRSRRTPQTSAESKPAVADPLLRFKTVCPFRSIALVSEIDSYGYLAGMYEDEIGVMMVVLSPDNPQLARIQGIEIYLPEQVLRRGPTKLGYRRHESRPPSGRRTSERNRALDALSGDPALIEC